MASSRSSECMLSSSRRERPSRSSTSRFAWGTPPSIVTTLPSAAAAALSTSSTISSPICTAASCAWSTISPRDSYSSCIRFRPAAISSGLLARAALAIVRCLDFPVLLLHRRDLENAVQIEAHAAEHLVRFRYRHQTLDAEVADQNVVEGVLVVPLIDLDIDLGLISIASGVALSALQRERCFAL